MLKRKSIFSRRKSVALSTSKKRSRGRSAFDIGSRSLAIEPLEERAMLAIVVPIPPGLQAGFELVNLIKNALPEDIRDQIPSGVGEFLDANPTFIYQAFPEETNDVTVQSNGLNFFLLLNENGDDVPVLRLPPAFQEDVLEGLDLGFAFIGELTVPIAPFIGLDLPSVEAIIPNPAAILNFFPIFDTLATGIRGFLDFTFIPELAFGPYNFPRIAFPEIDLGLTTICEGGCTIIPEFELIPRVELLESIEVRDIIPDELVDILVSIADFFDSQEQPGGGVLLSLLDGNDTADLSTLSGVSEVLLGGPGSDTFFPGGTDHPLQAFGSNLIPPGFSTPPIIVDGEAGRDTIVVNRTHNVEGIKVRGGSGNDRLLIQGSDANDVIRITAGPDGKLQRISFEVLDTGGAGSVDEVQVIKLPTGISSGSFTLGFGGETTGPISYSANPTTLATRIETALIGLGTISAGDVNVTGGGLDGEGRPQFNVAFSGALGSRDLLSISTVGDLLRRSGVAPVISERIKGTPDVGLNEIQMVTLPAGVSGGTFRVTLAGVQSDPIAHNATSDQFEQAMIDGGFTDPQVRVTGTLGGPWSVELRDNLGLTDHALMTIQSNLQGGVNATVGEQTKGSFQNEKQRVTIPASATGGTFTLSFGGETTVPISYNGSFVEVKNALAALSTINGPDNLDVVKILDRQWDVEFMGDLRAADQSAMLADGTFLTGGVSMNVALGGSAFGVNETQIISIGGATGGDFRLRFDNNFFARQTGLIPHDATAAEVQQALQSISSVGGATNVQVNSLNIAGGPWTVEFTGDLAGRNYQPMQVDDSGLIGTVSISVVDNDAGAVNEKQLLTKPTALSGTYTLAFTNLVSGVTAVTNPLAFDVGTADLLAALQSLSSIGQGNIAINDLGFAWEIEFVGALQGAEQNEFVPDGSSLVGDAADPVVLPVATEIAQAIESLNQIQTIVPTTTNLTAGDFTLRFNAGTLATPIFQTTNSIPSNASASTVEFELAQLAGIGAGNVSVVKTAPGTYSVDFVGQLAVKDQILLTADASNLAGGISLSSAITDNHQVFSAINEVQRLVLPGASGGTVRLRFSGLSNTGTTDPIAYSTNGVTMAARIRTALAAMSSVQGTGNITVASVGGQSFDITFTGALRAQDVSTVSVVRDSFGNAAGLESGLTPTIDENQKGGGTNEAQTIMLPANTIDGTMTFTFDDGATSATTANIAYNATTATVAARLTALSSIGTDGNGDSNVVVTQFANESQRVSLSDMTDSGTFRISFNTGTFDSPVLQTTGPINHNASAADVQAALALLPALRDGASVPNVSVEGPASGPWAIEFVNELASMTQLPLSVDSSGLQDSGGGGGLISTVEEIGQAGWNVQFVGDLAAADQSEMTTDGSNPPTDSSNLTIIGGNLMTSESVKGSNGATSVLWVTEFAELSSVELFQIEGGGGDDVLIIEGAVHFEQGIFFDGGDGMDTLNLLARDLSQVAGDSSAQFTAPIFPDDVQGTITMNDRMFQFTDVEGGITLDAGTTGAGASLSLSGTDEGNEIRFADAGTGVGDATFARDGQVTTTLKNFGAGTSLEILSAQGEDTIALALGNLTAFAEITIDGDGPVGTDAVIIEGRTGDDVSVHTPGAFHHASGTPGAEDASIAINAVDPVFVDLKNIADVSFVGTGGIDSLTITAPANNTNDVVLFDPEVGNNGSVQFTSQSGGPETAVVYSPVSFSSIENRTINTLGGSDTLSISSDELPGVNSSASVDGSSLGSTRAAFGDQSILFLHDLSVADTITLEIGTVVDDVTVTPGVGIDIVINTGLGADRLNYLAINEDVLLDPDNKSISQPSNPTVGTVSYTSVESLQLSARDGSVGAATGTNALTTIGTVGNDRFIYTPSGANAGSFETTAGANTSFSFSNFGAPFTIESGGGEADEVVVVGSENRDVITIDGTAGSVTVANLGGAALKPVVVTATEIISVNAGDGDDLIHATPSAVALIQIDGQSPNASDRLVVEDTGLGDVVRHHQGTDGRSGSVIVGNAAPIAYSAIEKVDILPLDPVTGGTGTDGLGRIVVFHADRFEHNDSRLNPTEMDDLAQSIIKPNIDPGGVTDPFGQGFDLPGDEDWYRFTAAKTGTFRFDILFDPIGTLPNSHPGLPGDGQLEIIAYLSDGTLLAKFATDTAASHTIGVEKDQTYMLRVRGLTPEAINVYDLATTDIDVLGPQVTDMFLTSDPTFNLFNVKPQDGPTPLVKSVSISIVDRVERADGFLYDALEQAIAETAGHYRLVGDHNGIIPIERVLVVNDPPVVGQLARATITLIFADPLPDDRFTLTVSDALVDPTGVHLDGESNAIEPHDSPDFPSGDDVSGGDFQARFTVDSRPEVGTWSAGSVYVDTNGNFGFDTQGEDFTNRDIVYNFGFATDVVFAGNFVGEDGDADGFDKLAAYGLVGFQRRWLIDTDNDGVFDIFQPDPANVNGWPVAGNFDGNPDNGDEVGVFDGSRWHFDTDHNYQVDRTLASQMRGLPFVGDFDGDGHDDLGTWLDDTFFLDLYSTAINDWDGVADFQFGFSEQLGFPGVQEHPVVADMNMDGFDDIGLWVPHRAGAAPTESGEWYFLVSGDTDLAGNPLDGIADPLYDRIIPNPDFPALNIVSYRPTPFGNDLYAQFGDEFAKPIVGNFDPPVASAPDVSPPAEVVSVTIGSDQWADSFVEEVAEQGAKGFVLPSTEDSPAGVEMLPWTNLNELIVQFSDQVELEIHDLTIRGTSVEDYSVTGFEYDDQSFIAKWTFDAPQSADHVLIELAGSDVYVASRFDVVPGDVDGSGANDQDDLRGAMRQMFTQAGDARYSSRFDVNGDGALNFLDLISVRDHGTAELPSAAPPVARGTIAGSPGAMTDLSAVFVDEAVVSEESDSDDEFERVNISREEVTSRLLKAASSATRSEPLVDRVITSGDSLSNIRSTRAARKWQSMFKPLLDM